MALPGRVPPYNAEAERVVLGSVLLDNECWGAVYSVLNEDDFYQESSRIIMRAMGGLFASNTVVDPVTLGHALKQAGDLEKIGGAIALSKLTDDIVTTAAIEHHANIVRETSAIRRVIYAAQEVSAEGFQGHGADQLSGGVEKLIEASRMLARTRMPDSLLSLGDKVLENYKMAEEGYRGIELPWPTLDNMTAGMWPKTVTVFVARPSGGKTAIAILCARHAWRSHGKRILIVSPEMSKVENAEGFFVTEAQVGYQNRISGQLPTMQKTALEQVIRDDALLDGLWIMDSDDDLSLHGIEAAIRACNPDLVALDALYHLRIPGDRRDRARIGLEWFVRNSKDLGYTGVCFTQQNRDAEKSEKLGGGIRLGTVAFADEIGQDVHAVFALHQKKDDKHDNIMRIIPLKLRRGRWKKPLVRIRWDWDVMDFEEIPDADDAKYNDTVPF